ncbi:MAG TPA: sugar MFS transporter [Steroidobacteraceae bacterium]|nr:sugar MFS transporter [Steroidobacteraceae bacterium]
MSSPLVMTVSPPAVSSGYRRAFILVTSLFFMWGLAYGLLDVLNKHFQEALGIGRARSALLQTAYFGAYFLMARPAALLMQRRGYKFGILLGLCLYASGAMLCVPATLMSSFDFFLGAMFILASGLACLETAANPYISLLGEASGAERRLNFSQSFNGLGAFLGPRIGGAFFFSTLAPRSNSLAVEVTYAVVALVVLVIAYLVHRTALPEIHESPIPHAGAGGVRLWGQRHFVGAVVAQFFYVAAQVGVGAFFINYVTEQQRGTSSSNASYLLSMGMLAFLVGRFSGTALMGRIAPRRLLTAYAIVNAVLCALVVAGWGGISVAALIATFFFMSIMFPTIFALGVADLGTQSKIAASFLIMSIVGGAIAPYLMGLIADAHGTALAYLIPCVCFAVVAWYGGSGAERGPIQAG